MSKLEIPSPEFLPGFIRGSVKAAMRDAEAKSADLWQVPRHMIRVKEGLNGRIRTPDYEQHVRNIADSIKANGYYQNKPLAGYVASEDGENIIYLTDGHTRLEAADIAVSEGTEIERLPIIIAPAGTSEEDILVSMVTNNEGRAFTPMEKAIFVKRLLAAGLTEAEIATRLVITRKYVTDLLTLLEAPKPVRDMIVTGKVAATLAIQEMAKNPKKAVERLTKAVEKATAAGKKKATKKHVEGDPDAKPVRRKSLTWDDVLSAADQVHLGDILDQYFSPDDIVDFLTALLADTGVKVSGPAPEKPADDENPADDL